MVNGVRYLETGEKTNTIGIFFRFDEAEANGTTIREYGFFGGDVEYVASVSGDLAMGGVFHQDRDLLDSELNEQQELINLERRKIADILFGQSLHSGLPSSAGCAHIHDDSQVGGHQIGSR